MKADENKVKSKIGVTKRLGKKSVNIKWNSSRYFQIGLILALLAAIGVMEIKVGFAGITRTSEDAKIIEEEPYYVFSLEKPQIPDPPKEKTVAKRTPEKKVLSDVIDVKPNNLPDVDETPTAPVDVPPIKTDSPKGPPISDVEEPRELNVMNVQFVPIYPGCDALGTNAEKVACMSSSINAFISRKFRTHYFDYLPDGSTQRISVQFKINSAGYIVDIQAQAPDAKLKEEAERVISLLPSMKPGRQGDKNVDVKYIVPINFKIEN